MAKLNKVPTEDAGAELVAIDPAVIAKAIQQIADASRAALNAGFKYETIVTLIYDHSKVPKKSIRLVLNNLAQFDDLHLRKPLKTIPADSPLNELFVD